ncbi:pyridoxine/pyridoxamine 5'-phosphate oxidase [Lederbergia citrea]|uniref:pyridoxine/pyridoxamine 5'-phosphate oxidase n=1 Tax=Lederbergia citrea TaxID=2833581 RepID=UPI001BC9FC10|nr:pyridoxal 5'-phosphate synthase [Lederbergia citrea]MBS4177029.1 pyridoxal 5'-phosphate synthase [Lederbergia citrea]
MKTTRNILRSLKVLEGDFPEFNTEDVPETPHELFLDWLNVAIEKGVYEPHAMTLSTIDRYGYPDARILILKDIDQFGWYFASSSESKKGQQLKIQSKVALTFYWSLIGRQVRIRGTVAEMGIESSANDFLSRSEIARAGAFIGKQSTTLSSRKDLDEALAKQEEKIKKEPTLVYPSWMLYRIKAEKVEFWQGDKERKHTRLQYRINGDKWLRELLWP